MSELNLTAYGIPLNIQEKLNTMTDPKSIAIRDIQLKRVKSLRLIQEMEQYEGGMTGFWNEIEKRMTQDLPQEALTKFKENLSIELYRSTRKFVHILSDFLGNIERETKGKVKKIIE